MANEPYKRVLGDFHPGQEFQHWPHKTITEGDHSMFCLLTMNHHPLHSDIEYAEGHQHGKIVVLGTYILSLALGMSVPDISGACIANLEFEKIIHHQPVFIGDTIRASTRIVEVKPSKTKPDRGVMTVITRAYNQDNEVVLSFRRKILLPKELR